LANSFSVSQTLSLCSREPIQVVTRHGASDKLILCPFSASSCLITTTAPPPPTFLFSRHGPNPGHVQALHDYLLPQVEGSYSQWRTWAGDHYINVSPGATQLVFGRSQYRAPGSGTYTCTSRSYRLYQIRAKYLPIIAPDSLGILTHVRWKMPVFCQGGSMPSPRPSGTSICV